MSGGGRGVARKLQNVDLPYWFVGGTGWCGRFESEDEAKRGAKMPRSGAPTRSYGCHAVAFLGAPAPRHDNHALTVAHLHAVGVAFDGFHLRFIASNNVSSLLARIKFNHAPRIRTHKKTAPKGGNKVK